MFVEFQEHEHEQEYVINNIDYTEQIEMILDEMKLTQELQVINLNNTYEILKIGIIVLGLAIGISIGSLFIKVMFNE